MTLSGLLNLRIALVVIAVLLAALGVSNGFVALFHQARYEVVYNHERVLNYCTHGNCAYSAKLSVANTGRRAQQLVSITISGLPEGVEGAPLVTNFSAAEPRAFDPVIEHGYREGTGTIRLRNLAPGAIVIFDFSGFVPEASLKEKPDVEITVRGRGRVIEADPRALTFGRYVT